MGEARVVMDRTTEALFAGDREGAKQSYAPDAIGVAPDGTELKGGHEIVEWLGTFFRAFPDAQYESIAKHESGNVAVDEGRFVGTNTGPIELPTGETLPATGKRVSMRGCDIVTVEGGVITSHHFYFDQLDFMTQLGLLPPL